VEREYQGVRAKIHDFKPCILILDGWPAYLTAARLSTELSIPLVYRSHNVEHGVLEKSVRSSDGAAPMAAPRYRKRMATLERQIRRDADLVLEISAEDAERMRALGWEERAPFCRRPGSGVRREPGVG